MVANCSRSRWTIVATASGVVGVGGHELVHRCRARGTEDLRGRRAREALIAARCRGSRRYPARR